MIAIDSETEAVLGLLDAKIWTRSDEVDATPARDRALEDKESMRWLEGAARAAERLPDATSVVVVANRESDIYAGFTKRPASIDLIVRAAQDRVLGDGGRLFAAPKTWPELARAEVHVAPSHTGVGARIARRLFKLALIGLAAATRTVQLVDARDGSNRARSNETPRFVA